MMGEYGEHVGVRAARKHLDWYLEALRIVLDKETRRTLLNAESPAAVLGMIPEVYSGTWRQAA